MACRGGFDDRAFPFVPGFESAGVVEQVGDGVFGFEPGDEVYVHDYAGGGFAEYRTVPASAVAHKPASLSFQQAASTPVAALTAHQSLIDALRLRHGETLLVTGAAGGVGSFAVQLAARVIGAEVIGTASPRNHSYLHELGAVAAVDYHDPDWPGAVRRAAGRSVDAVLDCAGGEIAPEILRSSIATVRDHGRIVYIPTRTERPDPKAEPRAERGVALQFLGVEPDGARLARLAELFDTGQLVAVPLDEVVPLQDASRALDLVSTGHTRGKIILTCAVEDG